MSERAIIDHVTPGRSAHKTCRTQSGVALMMFLSRLRSHKLINMVRCLFEQHDRARSCLEQTNAVVGLLNKIVTQYYTSSVYDRSEPENTFIITASLRRILLGPILILSYR